MRRMLDRVKAWLSGGPAAGKPRQREIAEKALAMKRRAPPDHQPPDHRTSHDGGIAGPQVGYGDAGIGKEPTYASELKRSHNARSGDA